MKIYKSLICSLLFLTLTACADEQLYDGSGETVMEGPGYIGDGEPIDIFVENMELRTRDVDFEENATLRINSVWLGVFDSSNGSCVSKYETTSGYAFVASGELGYGIVRHKLPAPSSGNNSSKTYFMVAVVNYQNVKGRWNSDPNNEHPLSDMLNSVTTWASFNSIGVDTQTAYDGDHSMDAPMMVGFLNGAAYNASSPASSHIRIDQFKQQPGKPELRMDGTPGPNNIYLYYNSNKFQTDGKSLNLRRLVSNINFNIELAPDAIESGLEIEGISYRKYNEPADIYIVERTMIDTRLSYDDNNGIFPEDASYSPNFADMAPTIGYRNDQADIPVDHHQENNKWSFSFQHFANKHWARNTPGTYAKREEIKFLETKDSEGNVISSTPYFTALCAKNGTEFGYDTEDFNNHASYIELKMRMLDRKRNRCAEAVYIIHEGMTSKHSGAEQNHSNSYIYSDFSCARNRNYTYNIKVHGFDNISYNVNGSNEEFLNSNARTERHDQQGKVWTISYIGDEEYDASTGIGSFGYNSSDDSFKKYLTGGGTETYGEGENTVKYKLYPNAFSIDTEDNHTPVMAFRVYGYNSEINDLEGFNFNFQEQSFDYLNGMWPKSVGTSSHYFNDYNSLIEDFHKGMSKEELENKIGEVQGENDYGDVKAELIDFLTSQKSSIEDLLFNTFKIRVNPGELSIPKLDDSEEVIFTDTGSQGDGSGDGIYKRWIVQLKIDINMAEWMNLEQFMRAINYLTKKGMPIPKNYDLMVTARDKDKINEALNEPNNKQERDLVRCLYIGDRAGKTDNDRCSTTIKIFAAIQGIQGLTD